MQTLMHMYTGTCTGFVIREKKVKLKGISTAMQGCLLFR